MKWNHVAPANRYDLVDETAESNTIGEDGLTVPIVAAEICKHGEKWYGLVLGEPVSEDTVLHDSPEAACASIKARVKGTPNLP